MNFRGAIFETEVAVRPDDLDLFQHVHSARYRDYVLAARFDQMKRCYGMAMEAFLEQGLGWVVRRSFIAYKRPLKMGDCMTVRTRVEEFFRDGVKVWFEILRLPGRKLCCHGWCDFTLVSLADGRAKPLPEAVREKLARDGGSRFATSTGREICQEQDGQLPANVREGVSVEKEKRRPSMERPEQVEHFGQGQLRALRRLPLRAARCLSFRIRAVLRASSLARCSIEADDKLPTPVFEKSGAGL